MKLKTKRRIYLILFIICCICAAVFNNLMLSIGVSDSDQLGYLVKMIVSFFAAAFFYGCWYASNKRKRAKERAKFRKDLQNYGHLPRALRGGMFN